MKKIVLMMVTFVATMCAFAQNEEVESGWIKDFTPAEEADDINAVRVAQAGDGSIYVASSYDQVFNFAGKALPDTDGMLSSAIMKYAADGNELWAISMVGNATVTAMAVDEDGTLYITGSFLDEVDYTGTDAVKATIKSLGAVSAFVAKVSKDGKFEVVKTFEPVGNLEVVLSEFPFYLPDEEPIGIIPENIQIDGDKVYVSATYKGDVEEFSWKGAYVVNYDFGMYFDHASAGVFSLNKSDLSGAANVAYVQVTGTISETQDYSEAINFVADNGTVYVGFFGFGNLTITTPAGTKDFEFAGDGEGMNEHGFVLATVGSTLTTKVFNAAKHDKVYKPYKVQLYMADDNIIAGGTFYGELPFDNTKNSGDFASDVFVTSLKKDGSVNWAIVGAVESQAVAMVVSGEVIYASSDKSDSTIKIATGEVIEDEKSLISVADVSAWGDDKVSIVAVAGNTVYVASEWMNIGATSVESIDASVDDDDVPVFNVLGQPIGPDYKGIAITKSGKKVYVK